jgi:hypothetical protein
VSGHLFILAPPRSFTSIICGMVGQHPDMMGLPEINLFAEDDYATLEARLYDMRPGFRHGLLRAIAEIGLGGQTVENVEAAQQWLEENRDLPAGEVFADLAAWAAPRRLVDKSPIYAYADESLLRIEAGVPGARYLHLTRHPRSVCESVFKLRERVQSAVDRLRKAGVASAGDRMKNNRLAEIDDPDQMWMEPHQRIMRFLDQVPRDRWLRMRGEDFMADPDRYLKDVAEWLGVDTGVAAIEAMKHPEQSPFACLGPRNARFGNDPSFMESPELRPYTPKPMELEGPLAGSGGTHLSDALKACARDLGYA